jgi:hypothetical protein
MAELQQAQMQAAQGRQAARCGYGYGTGRAAEGSGRDAARPQIEMQAKLQNDQMKLQIEAQKLQLEQAKIEAQIMDSQSSAH